MAGLNRQSYSNLASNLAQARPKMFFERRVILFAGVGIVCLVAYLVIRGKPFEDPNHATYVRMLLSLVIAVPDATTVGEGLNTQTAYTRCPHYLPSASWRCLWPPISI